MTRAARILVTGADGFIGSHLVEALARAGRRVRAYVFYNSFNSWGWLEDSSPEIKRSIEVVAGDIRDPHGVQLAVKDCEAILHLAALIAIPFSFHSPTAYVETNIGGTLNLLQAARDTGVRRFVHASTSEVYGTARFVPITEDHPLIAQSPYAASKIGADQMALSFQRSFNVPVVVLRPFNTYGPRQSARAVIPTILSQLLSGQNRVRLGALHPRRDFNYVADTVSAFIAALDAPGVEGETINAGSGFDISVEDMARLVAEVLGVAIEIEGDPIRVRPGSSEVDRLQASAAKAAQLLGWRPQYGGLDGLRQGVAETAAWLRRPENLVRYKPNIYNM